MAAQATTKVTPGTSSDVAEKTVVQLQAAIGAFVPGAHRQH